MKILHLSDIHFGRDYESYGIKGEFGNKTKILNNLLATIKSLSEKPAHIIMTGDIAWHGKKSEFEEALIWFKQLLKVTALSSDDITLCPGNHDVHRGYVNYPDVITADNPIKELDKYYQYGVIHKMETPLENYNWFCHELGVMPYNFPQEDHYCSSYSIGYKDIGRKDVRILSFNTALFSAFADYPDDRNLIGQYQIYDLLKYGLIGKQDDKYRIGIFHHAERFLHPDEISEYSSRKASLPFLRKYVDLVLCGHTETGGKPVLYHQDNGAYMLTAGAAYYDDKHPNAFSIIDVEKGCVPTVIPYICDGETWSAFEETKQKTDTICIEEAPVIGELKGEGKLVFSSTEDKYMISLSQLKAYSLPDENTALLDNRGDPTRLLDISADGPTIIPGKAKVHFKVATEKEFSVAAILERESLFAFMKDQEIKNREVRFEMMSNTGISFFSGNHVKSNGQLEGDKTGIDFLKMVRLIEEYYDIRFKCPEELYERDWDHVEKIVQLINTKYLLMPDEYTLATASINVDDKEKLEALYLTAKRNNSFYLSCIDDFVCKLIGKKFKMGKLFVISGPYKIDKKDLKHKASTFADGDSRNIVFSKTVETRTLLAIDGEEINISKLPCRKWKSGDIIQIGDMKLNFGFIIEQHI